MAGILDIIYEGKNWVNEIRNDFSLDLESYDTIKCRKIEKYVNSILNKNKKRSTLNKEEMGDMKMDKEHCEKKVMVIKDEIKKIENIKNALDNKNSN